MARPTQQDLFDALEPTPTASPGLVAVPRGRAPLSREQKRFNRLAEQIRDLRAELVRWEVYGTRYNARLAAEVEPAESGMRAAQRRLLLRLEGMLTARARGERLTRFQRDAVRSHVVMLAGEVLSAGPDPEVEALHDAYCEISHAEMERIALEGVLGSVLGDEAVAGNEARDADELMEHAREWIERQAEDQREREAESGRRGRRRAGAGEGGRAGSKRAGARESALGTVREIYRKLVSAIHPDREVDADARTRKTVLMQRANEAYQRDDLMTLLELQIELEQIDAAHLAAAPRSGSAISPPCSPRRCGRWRRSWSP